MRADAGKVMISISLAVSAVMLGGKLTAYWLTRSAAILSDFAESVVHGAAAALAAFSLWYASKPADESHPYGHGRIAYFSAGFEGALVFAAAVTVIYTAFDGLIRGVRLQRLGTGLSIAAALAAINVVLGLALVRVGRRTNALILVANGKHVLSDAWTTGAAIIGVGLVVLTGQTWLDPAAALLIGVGIMLSGVSLIRRSFGGLMDQADPGVSRTLIENLRVSVDRGLIADFHQLRHRRLNDEIWVDVHVLVPGDLSTLDAHARVTRAEDSIRGLFPGYKVRVTTHVEPSDHAAAHPEGHPELGDPLAGADAPRRG